MEYVETVAEQPVSFSNLSNSQSLNLFSLSLAHSVIIRNMSSTWLCLLGLAASLWDIVSDPNTDLTHSFL